MNMKRILCTALLAVALATPAFAARVYLKDGGVIQAKKVWREGGKVHVWITRDTMTSFEPSEVDLKRTFIKRHRTVKKVAAVKPQAQTTAATPNGVAASQNTVEKKAGVTLPKLPKLPEKSPESLAPSSGGSGTIKQHKKEMTEKTAD
jgi:hypothetical protein